MSRERAGWPRRAPVVLLLSLLGACRSAPLSGGDSGAGRGGEAAVEVAPPEEVAPAQSGTPLPPRAGGRSCEMAADCSWWQEPDPAALCCAGQCTNTRDDPLNCGGCGLACPEGQVCDGSQCRPTAESCVNVSCPSGWICCSGQCVSPVFYKSSCGGCAIECRFGGAVCRAGVCCPAADRDAGCDDLKCPDGQILCVEGCRDVTSNALSCGGCGIVCPRDRPRCVSGICRP
jgi:hypothetical protein